MKEIHPVVAAIDNFDGFLYTYILLILLVGAGLYFSFRTKFVQIRLIGESLRVISEPKKDKNSISSFQALMVSTASRVGTGNIIGVTSAILTGGSGAVFWMWLIAILGGASAFVESTLAQIYKKRGPEGSYGGPAYYIKQALRSPVLGGIFVIALILTYMGGFNALASYNLTSAITSYVTDPSSVKLATKLIGLAIALLAAVVIFGGGKRISQVTKVLVPIMASLYILSSLIVIGMNISALPKVISDIFVNAFDFKSIFGGFLGSAIMLGIKRGLYSNEAGVGSAPNAAAAADVSHPVKQGLVQMLSVFIDTLLICSATAFMILCTGLDGKGMDEAPFIQATLSENFGAFGGYFITFALLLFAYTTLVGNYFYAEANISYLKSNALESKSFIFVFRLIAVVIIFVGAMFNSLLAWDLADILMGLMALINIPVCILLGKKAFAALNDYIKQKNEGKNPEFKASDIGIKGTDYWN